MKTMSSELKDVLVVQFVPPLFPVTLTGDHADVLYRCELFGLVDE